MLRMKASFTLPLVLATLLAGCVPSAPGTGAAAFTQPSDQSLMGATPQALSSEFGQPAILRVDGTAQVWLYHQGACGLNLVLYPDSGGTPRVALAAPTHDGADMATCSAALQRAHADLGAAVSAAAAPAAPPPAIIPASTIPMSAPASTTAAGADGLERPSSS